MKIKAPRNKTLEINKSEIPRLKAGMVFLNKTEKLFKIINKTLLGDFLEISEYLP